MKIITLIQASQVLQQFSNVKLSPKLAYKIMKFCKDSSAEEQFYNSKKAEIINMYAEKDQNNEILINDGFVSIVPDKINMANQELHDLDNIDVDAPSIMFKLSELEELKLSVSEMYALDAFIEE